MTDHDPDSDELRAAAQASFAQVLLRAARLVDERATERVRQIPGAPGIRPAHTKLFPFIPFDGGIRATRLAAALGVTKQAITPLVQDLVGWGLVEQVPDPADGRARLVIWTALGRRRILDGIAVLREVEAPWREAMGDDVVQTVHRALAALVDLLENPG